MTWAWSAVSFVAGVIVAYVIQFLADAVLSPWLRPVKEFFDRRDDRRIRRRAQRRAARHSYRHSGQQFVLLPGYAVPFERADGAGDAPVRRANLTASLTHKEVVLPGFLENEVAQLRQHPVDRSGRPVTNNPRYAVRRCEVGTRSGIDEEVAVHFELDYSDYANFLVTQELDDPREALEGRSLRETYLEVPRDEIPAFMLNSVGAHVLIVTADNRAVFTRRSCLVSVQEGRLGASVSEGLSRTNDSHGQAAPDLWGVAERGLDEEAGLDRGKYDLTLLTVGLCRDANQWVLLFMAETPLTLADVIPRMERAAKDLWEHSAVFTPDFDPNELISFLFFHRDEVLSLLPPLVYHALVHRFGRPRIEAALERAARATRRA